MALVWAAVDERETEALNQMLVEMDGFEGNERYRCNVGRLDPAGAASGRLTVRVMTCRMCAVVKRNLKVHMRRVPLARRILIRADHCARYAGLPVRTANGQQAALFAARGGTSALYCQMVEVTEAGKIMMMGAETCAPW